MMIGNLFFLGLLACWEKSTVVPAEPTNDPSPTAETTDEPTAETTDDPSPTTEPTDEPSVEPSSEDLRFECAEEICTEGQYCYQFYPGVFDTAGPPDPYCETMPAECTADYSCECLIHLGICMDCSIEHNGGIYCTLAGAK